MKRTYTVVVVTLMACIFLISFFIGRATALKENDGQSDVVENFAGASGFYEDVKEEAKETTTTQQNVPVADNVNVPAEKKTEDTAVSVPERMLFPCGKTVLKDYSQTAVYSETMGDWRGHTGIDYSAPLGADVLCVCDGTVGKSYKDKLWGYTVEIVHSERVKSVYKNLDKNIAVKKGDKVKGGQIIGKVGQSADIESLEKPHLHFEIWQDGMVINPTTYVY